MALKFLKKKTTKLKSFLREYSISLYLSPCPFIINMFGIAFETDEYYVFAQEYALAGDLFDIIPPQVLHLICRHMLPFIGLLIIIHDFFFEDRGGYYSSSSGIQKHLSPSSGRYSPDNKVLLPLLFWYLFKIKKGFASNKCQVITNCTYIVRQYIRLLLFFPSGWSSRGCGKALRAPGSNCSGLPAL